MVAADNERFGKLESLRVFKYRFAKNLRSLSGVTAVDSPLGFGQLESYDRIQFLGSFHDTRNRMFDPGIAAHNDHFFVLQGRKNIFAAQQADGTLIAEDLPYFFGNSFQQLFIHTNTNYCTEIIKMFEKFTMTRFCESRATL